MRFLLISVGSRGDAEPFCALAQQLLLADDDHQVELFLQPEHEPLVPSGCQFHPLPFNSIDFYKYAGNPQASGSDHANPRVKFVGIVSDLIAGLVLPTAAQVSGVIQSTHHVDAMVCSSLARPLAIALAEKHNIPLAIVHLQPLAPTRLFPHSSHSESCIQAILQKEATTTPTDEEGEAHVNTYLELEQHQYIFLKEALDKTYQELGLTQQLQSFDHLKDILMGHQDRFHIANCFSRALVPDDPNKSANIHNIGPLADSYVPTDFEPPADLVAFLDDCSNDESPPICIGYGSMPFDKVQLVLEALEELQLKAILVGKALEITLDNEYANNGNVFQISGIPYPWLLPKCRMMLSHGGAGVLNATLRAGIPAVISPLMGDQFFWADLVVAKHVGARTAMLPALTKADIVQGIQQGIKCQAKARAMGEEIRTSYPVGVQELQKLLETVGA